MKGQMLGSRSLEDDISLAHSVHASSLQSEVSGRTCNRAAPAPTTHSQLMSIVLLVVGAGSVLTPWGMARSIGPSGYQLLLLSSERLG